MTAIDDLPEILLKSKITASDLRKVSVKGSPVENAVKALVSKKPDSNLQTLNLSLLKNYLPAKTPLGKAFINLVKLLSSSSNSTITPQARESLISTISSIILKGKEIDENLLKNLIEKTGLNYEADIKKLVDNKKGGEPLGGRLSEKLTASLRNSIKGQLMGLVREIEIKLNSFQQAKAEPQFKQLQELLNNIKTALSNIELEQILNYYSKREDGFLQFQIPYSASETVRLYVKDNLKKNKEKKRKEKEDISLIFLLDLKGIGNLRVDVQMVDKSLICQLYVESKKISQFVSSMLPELKDKLEENYDVSHLNCTVKEKSFFEQEKPDKELFQKKRQIINVKA